MRTKGESERRVVVGVGGVRKCVARLHFWASSIRSATEVRICSISSALVVPGSETLLEEHLLQEACPIW